MLTSHGADGTGRGEILAGRDTVGAGRPPGETEKVPSDGASLGITLSARSGT